VKKSEKTRFYGQNKLFFEHPTLQPLGSFSHMAACRSSSENTGKMSLIPVFNKNLPRASSYGVGIGRAWCSRHAVMHGCGGMWQGRHEGEPEQVPQDGGEAGGSHRRRRQRMMY
jgi:hypothetical protein